MKPLVIAHLTDVHLGPIAGFTPRHWNLKRLLGYIMAKFTVVESEERAQRSRARIRVSPKLCPWLTTIAQEFAALVARHKDMLPGGTTHADQFALPMSGPEYADFLRRCGLDQRGEKE
jgi:hypothetical protein